MTSHRYIQKLWKGGKVMSKLSPKPTDKNPKKSWKDLDSTLQAAFKIPTKDMELTILVDTYEMSVEEIIEEAKKAGYNVKKINDNVLKFF